MSKAVKSLAIGAAVILTFGVALPIALGMAGHAAAALAVGKAAFYLGASIALSGISLALAGTPQLPRVVQDVEYSGTVESRRIVYGRMKMSGMNVIPPLVSGANGERLHQVLALAGHAVNSITTAYPDQSAIDTTEINAITGTVDDGLVNDGFWDGLMWIRRYDGTQTTADFKLLTERSADWTVDHVGEGVAYVALTYKLDQEVYARGKPVMTFLVEGKKCYDPRLDTAPGANPTNVSYIAYTTNPALCLADYLLDANLGLGEAASRIDWSLVVAAANICDEQVQTVGASIQNRYTCNVVLDATDRYENNITILASAMMGHCYYSGGKWLVYAGAWQTPSFALTQDDVLGNFEIMTAFSYQERYNAVRGRYVDAARNYQEVEFNPRVNSAYVTEDGETIWRDAFFPACNNEYEAQRNAIIALRMSRNKQAVQATFGMRAWGIRPFQTGTLTIPELGWNAQPVTCESWQFQPDGTISMTLREAASSAWNDPAEGDYGTPDAIGVPIVESFKPFAVVSFSAVGYTGGVTLTWAANQTNPSTVQYQIYRKSTATPLSGATLVATVSGNSYFDIRYDTSTWYYWVRVRDYSSGAVSDPTPDGNGSSAAAITASGGAAFGVELSATEVVGYKNTFKPGVTGWTTATAFSGVEPYTFDWQRISGSTDILLNQTQGSNPMNFATFATPAPGTSISAVFEVTATDSDSPAETATAQVTATFYRS